MILYKELSQDYPDDKKPILDRKDAFAHLDSHMDLIEAQHSWRKNGVIAFNKLLSDEKVQKYIEFREKLKEPGGFKDPCPYLRHEALKDISLDPAIMNIMENLIGHKMGLHLNLTGWKSTERKWHSDDYLNPDFVYSHYCAVWIALDDIHADSGPFQFVLGSHRWNPLRRDLLFNHITAEERVRPDWPTTTERIVAEACEKEIEDQKAAVSTYLPKKGDVLFWHGRLIHRGSLPKNPELERRALICHYSSLDHRPDMPDRRFHNGEAYFHFDQFTKEKYKDEYPV